MLEAATDLFSTHGWSGTSVRAIAASAGVAVETVYATVGSKLDVLLAAIDVAVVGDEDAVPLAGRAEFASVASGSVAERATAAAHLGTVIHQRSAGVWMALREAAAAEPPAAAHLRTLEERRRDDVAELLGLVAGHPVDERDRDGIWAMGMPEGYRLLVNHAGWSAEQYTAWIADALLRLLDTPPHGELR